MNGIKEKTDDYQRERVLDKMSTIIESPSNINKPLFSISPVIWPNYTNVECNEIAIQSPSHWKSNRNVIHWNSFNLNLFTKRLNVNKQFIIKAHPYLARRVDRSLLCLNSRLLLNCLQFLLNNHAYNLKSNYPSFSSKNLATGTCCFYREIQ